MIILGLVLLGLCLGSFIEALVWRLHQPKYSILKGRSVCPKCKHQLGAADLIPLLSWIELRGRCRYCQAKIGWQAPAIELLTAGLFVLSYIAWPFSFSLPGKIAFGVWLATAVVLIALTAYDLRWMLLPNRLVYPVTGLAVTLVAILAIEGGSAGLLLGPVLGAAFLSGLFWLLFQFSDGAWIGGGDVKLAVALGLIAGGLLETVLLLFIASLLGSLVGIPLLVRGKKASHKLPFGPFLILATLVVFLWGADMIDWYAQFTGV